MECPGCGNSIAQHANACEQCGRSVACLDPGADRPAATPGLQLLVEPTQRRSGVSLLVVILFVVFTAAGTFLRLSMERKRISDLSNADLWKQLSSAEPIDSDLGWRDQRIMRGLRATFADLMKFRQSQAAKAAALEADLQLVYSPESFSSPEKMQKAVAALNQCLAIDSGTMAELQKGPDSLRTSLEEFHLSQSEKQEVIRIFSEGLLNSDLMELSQQSLAAESAWVDATTDLYRFALQHSAQVAVQGGRIVIGSAPIRKQFDEKLDRSNSLHAVFLTAYQREQKLRTEEMGEAGMTPDPRAEK